MNVSYGKAPEADAAVKMFAEYINKQKIYDFDSPEFKLANAAWISGWNAYKQWYQERYGDDGK